MTYERLESRPNFYEFEEGKRDEEDNKVSLNQSELSTRVLSKLNYIFSDLFDYLRIYQYNDDYEMENEAFRLLAQLKTTHYKRNQLNETEREEFDELIEKMRRDLSGDFGNMYRTGEFDIPVEYIEGALKGYQEKYSSIGINMV